MQQTPVSFLASIRVCALRSVRLNRRRLLGRVKDCCSLGAFKFFANADAKRSAQHTIPRRKSPRFVWPFLLLLFVSYYCSLHQNTLPFRDADHGLGSGVVPGNLSMPSLNMTPFSAILDSKISGVFGVTRPNTSEPGTGGPRREWLADGENSSPRPRQNSVFTFMRTPLFPGFVWAVRRQTGLRLVVLPERSWLFA